MGHQTLSRRAFVFGSAAVAGGIAFGAYSEPPRSRDCQRKSTDRGPCAEFRDLQSLGRDQPRKITLIAQHADIGQGVGSVQPIMIAEEMDLEPGQFEVRFAGPSPAYFNTGFADEFAPFVAADQSPAAEEARAKTLEWLRRPACR